MCLDWDEVMWLPPHAATRHWSLLLRRVDPPPAQATSSATPPSPALHASFSRLPAVSGPCPPLEHACSFSASGAWQGPT